MNFNITSFLIYFFILFVPFFKICFAGRRQVEELNVGSPTPFCFC